jgi:hypothetical protein
MKAVMTGLIFVLALCANSLAVEPSAPSAAASNDLSKTYPMKLGNIFALSLQQATEVFKDNAKWREPLIVSFDSKESRLGIRILGGSRTTIDSAKKTIDEFKTEVLGPALAHTNETLGTDVAEDQIRVTYLSGATLRPLITLENGTFVIN